MGSAPDVVVVGGGVIGLAVAFRASTAGLAVTVVDPDPCAGASRVAAGMLAPVTEFHYGEEALLALNLASARRWPTFAAELAEASGVDPGFRASGTLAVGASADDVSALRELADHQASLGLGVEVLTSRECRALEPGLAPSVRGGVLCRDDHSVDVRALAPALLSGCRGAGVKLAPVRATGLVTAGGGVAGVDTDGGRVAAGAVVLAAGAWSASLAGVPADLVPVRPVKGQILRLKADDGILTRTVRATVAGSGVYLVPRTGGRVVVGATAEEKGWDESVTAGAVQRLLSDALAVVPGLDEAELLETAVSWRPGTPDNGPIIGAAPPPAPAGLVLATGHYRNGILLTPITADAVAAVLTGGDAGEAAAFTPGRFHGGAR